MRIYILMLTLLIKWNNVPWRYFNTFWNLYYTSILNSHDHMWTHRSVAFVTESHRALCGVITVRIIFNTHAVSKGSCGKLAQSSQPSWRNCKVGCYFYQGFTFYFFLKSVCGHFFLSVRSWILWKWDRVVMPFFPQEQDYLYTCILCSFCTARLIHNSDSIIHHKWSVSVGQGVIILTIYPTNPSIFSGYERLSWLLLSGWWSCAIGSASGLSCCYSSVKSMT